MDDTSVDDTDMADVEDMSSQRREPVPTMVDSDELSSAMEIDAVELQRKDKKKKKKTKRSGDRTKAVQRLLTALRDVI